ncbi:hypothetical protein HDU97_009540 [Phlyctochytrium planicorne]|nr:hypothetical protein HDU97_009540 [Phlyctochytrium planicorne]
MSLIYRMIRTKLTAGVYGFTSKDVPDLVGKNIIVTGASSGLGLASTLEMAKRGAHIYMACRSVQKAIDAAETLKKENPDFDLKLTVMELELSSFASVRKFAEEFTKLNIPLHVIMNNAGVMAIDKFTLSSDGIEMQIHANHLGHFYLTTLLLPLLEKTAETSEGSVRVVNLSSIGHTLAKKHGIDFEGYNDPEKYESWAGYGQAKLANILFTKELHRRLEAKGAKNIKVNATHPGGVQSNLSQQSQSKGISPFVLNLLWYTMVPASVGCLTQLYAATSHEIDTENIDGAYLVPTAEIGKPSALALDAELAKKLWDWSEKIITDKGFSLSL